MDLCGYVRVLHVITGIIVCVFLFFDHVAAVVVPPRATLGSRHSAVEPHEINLHLFRRKPC